MWSFIEPLVGWAWFAFPWEWGQYDLCFRIGKGFGYWIKNLDRFDERHNKLSGAIEKLQQVMIHHCYTFACFVITSNLCLAFSTLTKNKAVHYHDSIKKKTFFLNLEFLFCAKYRYKFIEILLRWRPGTEYWGKMGLSERIKYYDTAINCMDTLCKKRYQMAFSEWELR